MYCSQCGAKIGEDNKFCPTCGQKVSNRAESGYDSPKGKPSPEGRGKVPGTARNKHQPEGEGDMTHTPDEVRRRKHLSSKRLRYALIIFPILIIGVISWISINNHIHSLGAFWQQWPMEIQEIEYRLHIIDTPPLASTDLTPARDLVGVWSSAIWGKGMQLSGTIKTADGTSSISSEGDLEIKIDRVESGYAYGTARYFNLSLWGQAATPVGTIPIPKTYPPDAESTNIQIKVDGSHFGYGPVTIGGSSSTLEGNYTSDMMSGTLTVTTPYGPIPGTFRLKKM